MVSFEVRVSRALVCDNASARIDQQNQIVSSGNEIKRVLLALAPKLVPLNSVYQVYCNPTRVLNHGQPGAGLLMNGM